MAADRWALAASLAIPGETTAQAARPGQTKLLPGPAHPLPGPQLQSPAVRPPPSLSPPGPGQRQS